MNISEEQYKAAHLVFTLSDYNSRAAVIMKKHGLKQTMADIDSWILVKENGESATRDELEEFSVELKSLIDEVFTTTDNGYSRPKTGIFSDEYLSQDCDEKDWSLPKVEAELNQYVVWLTPVIGEERAKLFASGHMTSEEQDEVFKETCRLYKEVEDKIKAPDYECTGEEFVKLDAARSLCLNIKFLMQAYASLRLWDPSNRTTVVWTNPDVEDKS